MADYTNNIAAFYNNVLVNKGAYTQEFIQGIKNYDTNGDDKIDADEVNKYVLDYIASHSIENLTADQAKSRIMEEIQAFSITINNTAGNTVKDGLNKVLANTHIYNQAMVDSAKAFDTDGNGIISDNEISNSGISKGAIANHFVNSGVIRNEESHINNNSYNSLQNGQIVNNMIDAGDGVRVLKYGGKIGAWVSFKYGNTYQEAGKPFIAEVTPPVLNPNTNLSKARYIKLAQFDENGNLAISENYTLQFSTLSNGTETWRNPGDIFSYKTGGTTYQNCFFDATGYLHLGNPLPKTN